MEQPVDYYTVKFIVKLRSIEYGVFPNCVDADEKISGKSLAFALVEGNDVSEIVVL